MNIGDNLVLSYRQYYGMELYLRLDLAMWCELHALFTERGYYAVANLIDKAIATAEREFVANPETKKEPPANAGGSTPELINNNNGIIAQPCYNVKRRER